MGLNDNDVKFNNFNEPLYITGFYAKGSSEIKEINNDLMDLSELSLMPSVLLQLAQIKPNEFFKANYAIRKICKKVEDHEDKDLLTSYKSYFLFI